MPLPTDEQERRTRVFGNVLFACVFAIPFIGWAAMVFALCVAPFAILMKSSQRIVDLAMLALFGVCYFFVEALGYIVVKTFWPDYWGLSGIFAIPVCVYFLYQADQREFGRAKPMTKPAPPTAPRQLPSHWE